MSRRLSNCCPRRSAKRIRKGMVVFMRGLVIETAAVLLLIFLYLSMQASASDSAGQTLQARSASVETNMHDGPWQSSTSGLFRATGPIDSWSD